MNSGEGSIRVAPIKLQERDAKENPRGLRYVAAFDGLRAMAVGSVLVSHMLANTPAGWISAIAKQGWYGVDVFFVLSGFLITSLLATELDRTQGINIPRFYVRRALRLQPAYFSAIILMVAGHWLTGGFVTAVNRLPYLLTYTFNIAVALGWVGAGGLMPAWTLCIEEQFYLIWPNVLLRLGPRNALRVAVGGAILVAIYRTVLYTHGASPARVYYSTDTRFDTLLVGCAAALLLRRGTFTRLLRWPHFPMTASLCCVLCLGVFLSSPFLTNTLGYTVMAISVALVIVAIYSCEDFVLTRILSTQWLVFVGRYLLRNLYLSNLDDLSRFEEPATSRQRDR